MAVQHALRSPPRPRHVQQRSRSSAQAAQIRMALICAMFVGCGVVLVWRLYTLQVLDTTRYQQLADDERHAQISSRDA